MKRFILLGLILYALPVSADTVVNGLIHTDTTWTSDDGTYVIDQNLEIAEGTKLTINPGVVVKFADSASLNILGTLIAQGSTENPIVFTSLDSGDFTSEWHIIFNTGSQDSKLEHVVLSNSQNPLNIYYTELSFKDITFENVDQGINLFGGKLTLERAYFQDVMSDAIDALYSEVLLRDCHTENVYRPLASFTSKVKIYDSSFKNSPYQHFGIYDGSQFYIENSKMEDAGWASALSVYGPNVVEIKDTIMDGGLSYGIEMYGNRFLDERPQLTITNSTIKNFIDAGLEMYDALSANISRSRIENNSIGIQTFESSLFIDNSSIINNDLYALLNLTPNDVDVRNNWWGSASGPSATSNATGTGDIISGSASYSPWLKGNPFLKTPVIIVPGIMATELVNSVKKEIWPNISFMILPGSDAYLDELLLDESGKTINEILADSVLKKVESNDFFDGLLKNLQTSELFEKKYDIFEYPYDWRLDINVIVSNLKEKIDEIKRRTGSEKVDIIAHSMGGLLIKKFIKDNGGNSINTFVDIGTPHTGSPKAFKILNYGDDMGFHPLDISILNIKEIFRTSQNMPSVYELLPSQKYFESTDNSYKYYVFDAVSGDDRLTYDQTSSYLKASGRNSALVDQAEKFHQEIDNLNPEDYGVETYNIVGCGTPTLGQFYILDNTEGHPKYNIKLINGDGTVPLKSAEAMQALKTYYVKGAEHALMPSLSGVKELVTSILTATNTNDIDISQYSNLALDSKNCQIPNGTLVSFHSPIDLHVYDQNGNHSGPDLNGDIENNIPGIAYETIEDNKFAFLPDGMDYIVKGNATNPGKFDVRIQDIIDGEVTETTVFADIPLTTSTHTEFDIGTAKPEKIPIDNDGDGIFETSYPITTQVQGLLESTGKNATQTSKVIGRSRSKSGSNRPFEIIKKESTTSNIVLEIAKIKERKTSGVQERVTKVINTKKDPSFQNTAVAYKSFTSKLKGSLHDLWSWFINKI